MMSHSNFTHGCLFFVKHTVKLTLTVSAIVILSGCAAGKLFMAGYKPPQTIADLLNEQYALAGEVPPNGIRGATQSEMDISKRANTEISGLTYSQERTVNNKAEEVALTAGHMPAPVQRFRPNFTYKSVQDYAGQLAMDLIKNANGLQQDAAIGVTSFVKLDESLQNTTILGNQLAEYSISEIQQFGLKVIDFKLMPAIQVSRNGDLAFSRNIQNLAKHKVMDHVLAATMIEKADGVFINARIIALHTNAVVSSASILVPNFVANHTYPQYLSYVN